MTDDSQPPPYGFPPGQGPRQGQARPAQYGPQPEPQPGQWQPPHQQRTPQYGRPPAGEATQFDLPPQYGQYGQQAQFPPPVATNAIKPSLWWLAAPWGVFLACVAVGVYFLVDGMAGMVDVAPTRTFASGESVTVQVDPANRPGVFIAGDTEVAYDCSISGGSGQARLARTTDAQTITAMGAEWEQFLVINAPAKGEYQLTCTDQGQATVRYGVGGDLSSAVGRAAGGMFTLIFVPAAGLLVAIGGTIGVLLLRRRARRRLARSG